MMRRTSNVNKSNIEAFQDDPNFNLVYGDLTDAVSINNLVKEIGTKWFNQGNPTLGTVGVFSKFYCLNEKDTKTVDELFPNGFKP